jgi:peptidoglycan/LPS O-acetylase OafA/YrhL
MGAGQPDYLTSGVFVLTLLLIPLMYPRIYVLILGYNHKMWVDIGVLFHISIVFFFLVFLVPDNNVFLSNRIGDFIGRISYSLYLLHKPVLNLLKKPANEQPEIFLLIFLVVSIIVSYISYLIIEKPSRKAIRKFAPKIVGS